MFSKNIPWFFLSEYSPALNYIERVFKSSGENFDNLNDFEEKNIIKNIFSSYLIEEKTLKNYYLFHLKNILSYI